MNSDSLKRESAHPMYVWLSSTALFLVVSLASDAWTWVQRRRPKTGWHVARGGFGRLRCCRYRCQGHRYQRRDECSQSTNASSDGTYEFPNLLIGSYTVTVEKEGFKKYIGKGVRVAASQVADVTVKLELGEASVLSR